MHQTAPRTVLGNAWWEKERQAAFASTNYHCEACGVSKYQAQYHQWLEGHEIYKIDYAKGLCKYVRTVPLCHFCHNWIHIGRLTALLQKGDVHQAKYVAIVQHGDRIVKASGLTRALPYEGPVAPWHKWRLVIGRKRYKGKFPTLEAWCKEFSYDPATVRATHWFNF